MLLLLPTGFAALGSPVALLALPSLLLRFMSVNPAYWGTGWHYNATVMPVLFIAAAEAIGRWQRAPALAWPLTRRSRRRARHTRAGPWGWHAPRRPGWPGTARR